MHFIDDQLQKPEIDTCGIFQLYFYVNLFNPIESSIKSEKIISGKTLMKKNIEKILTEIFTTDKDENKKKYKVL